MLTSLLLSPTVTSREDNSLSEDCIRKQLVDPWDIIIIKTIIFSNDQVIIENIYLLLAKTVPPRIKHKIPRCADMKSTIMNINTTEIC